MDLPTLIDRFANEDRCREFLEQLRWPNGVFCPRCEHGSVSRIETRKLFECNAESCRYQFSVTAGTVFHDSHLPLTKWFIAIYLIGESKKGISAKQLQRNLGVSYKTAWYLGHRIRSAMEEGSPVPLRGIVEADETFVGGKHRDTGGGPHERKTMVMGAVARGGDVQIKVIDRADRKTREAYRDFVKQTISDDATHIYTDASRAWGNLTDDNTVHEKVNHGREEWVRANVHTNTIEGVWSLLKRSIVGSYHQLSAKHLPAYLDEVAFRFNNRDNPYLFRDTLLRLVEGDALTYAALVDS